jgi:hypothetical protein
MISFKPETLHLNRSLRQGFSLLNPTTVDSPHSGFPHTKQSFKKTDFLESNSSLKTGKRFFAATDALSYNQTPLLLQQVLKLAGLPGSRGCSLLGLSTVPLVPPQVIRNLVLVLRLMSAQKPPAPSAGLDLLLAAKPAEGQAAAGSKEGSTGHGYSRREVDYAWECMQKEAQSLLSELLQPGELQGNLRDFHSGKHLLKGLQYVKAKKCERIL